MSDYCTDPFLKSIPTSLNPKPFHALFFHSFIPYEPPPKILDPIGCFHCLFHSPIPSKSEALQTSAAYNSCFPKAGEPQHKPKILYNIQGPHKNIPNFGKPKPYASPISPSYRTPNFREPPLILGKPPLNLGTRPWFLSCSPQARIPRVVGPKNPHTSLVEGFCDVA